LRTRFGRSGLDASDCETERARQEQQDLRPRNPPLPTKRSALGPPSPAVRARGSKAGRAKPLSRTAGGSADPRIAVREEAGEGAQRRQPEGWASLHRPGKRWCAARRMPVPGRLLVTVADPDQYRLTPWPAQNLQAGRKVPAHKAHWNGHRRKPGRRRDAGAVVAVRLLRSPISRGG